MLIIYCVSGNASCDDKELQGELMVFHTDKATTTVQPWDAAGLESKTMAVSKKARNIWDKKPGRRKGKI